MTTVETQTEEALEVAPQGGLAAAAGLPEGARDEGAERHLRLLPPRPRRRAGQRLLVAGLVAGAVTVAFGLVVLHALIAENQFRIDSLEQQATARQEHYEKLRLEVAQAEAPGRIVSMAERIGMVEPGAVTYVPAPAAGRAGAGSAGTATGGGGGGVARAPAGDANWPSIKPLLSGAP